MGQAKISLREDIDQQLDQMAAATKVAKATLVRDLVEEALAARQVGLISRTVSIEQRLTGLEVRLDGIRTALCDRLDAQQRNLASERAAVRLYAVHIFRGVMHAASFARVAAVASGCDGDDQAQVDAACEWLERNAERPFADHQAQLNAGIDEARTRARQERQAVITSQAAKPRASDPRTRKVIAGKASAPSLPPICAGPFLQCDAERG